jgi:hypothetical protein
MMDYKYIREGGDYGGGWAQGCGSQLLHPQEAPGWIRQGLLWPVVVVRQWYGRVQ